MLTVTVIVKGKHPETFTCDHFIEYKDRILIQSANEIGKTDQFGDHLGIAFYHNDYTILTIQHDEGLYYEYEGEE